MRGHQDSVHSAELLMFSNIILSSSVDKTLMLWDARTVNSQKKNFIKTNLFLGFSRTYICWSC
jgi:WD40 repeat protein